MGFDLISIDKNAHTRSSHLPSKFGFYIQLSIHKWFLKTKKKGQKLLLSREIDATWFQSPKITYSNDFLAQFWGRGKNRTRFGPSLVGQQPPALYAHVHTKDLSALNRPYLSHKHKDNSSRYNLWPDRCASHLLAVFTNGSSTRGCFMLFFTTLRYLSINAPDECPTGPTKLPFIIYSSFLRSKGA